MLRWELLPIIGGVFLLFAVQELPYQWLWMVTTGSMIAKGDSCRLEYTRAVGRSSIGLSAERRHLPARELDHCALAILLLHALGWIGRS